MAVSKAISDSPACNWQTTNKTTECFKNRIREAGNSSTHFPTNSGIVPLSFSPVEKELLNEITGGRAISVFACSANATLVSSVTAGAITGAAGNSAFRRCFLKREPLPVKTAARSAGIRLLSPVTSAPLNHVAEPASDPHASRAARGCSRLSKRHL